MTTFRKLLFYVRGYFITPDSIWLRQQREWVELRRDQIAALKIKSVSQVIVRSYDGRRLTVNLYGLSNRSDETVCRWFREALCHNETTRGLWDGAKKSE